MVEDVFDKLRNIFDNLEKVGEGIDYIREVIAFVEKRDDYFSGFWDITYIPGKVYVYIRVPWWNNGIRYSNVHVMTLDVQKKVSFEEIMKKVDEKRNAIINELLDGFTRFLDDILESGSAHDC